MNRLTIGHQPIGDIQVGADREEILGAFDDRGREITPRNGRTVTVPAGGFIVSDGQFIQIDRPLKLTKRVVKVTDNGYSDSYQYDILEECV